MGILSWWKGDSKPKSQPPSSSPPNPNPSLTKDSPSPSSSEEVPGMNGAVEVPRAPREKVTIFEFGSVAATADKVTLAGYCPVSDDLEPCRWEILPAGDGDAPQFRVAF